MSSAIPRHIVAFLQREHLVSLACQADGELWAANCFYWFDPSEERLIILTSSQTTHGKLMQRNPQIAGTIAHATTEINAIEGVQFRAIATGLHTEKARETALAGYYARFPQAKGVPSEVWQLSLYQLKHTCNQRQFAEKSHWVKDLPFSHSN